MILNLSRLGKSGTGMWQYSIKLLDALHELNQLEGIICAQMHEEFFKKYNCLIFTVPDWVSNTSKISKLRPILWFLYSFIMYFRLKKKLLGKNILSTTHHYLPFFKNQIITIHDLRPYFYPDSLLQKIYFRYLLSRNIGKLLHILTVSETVKDQIALSYGVSKDKISVIYNAIDISEFQFKEEDNNNRFLLAVGASWKHKNIHTLLENYQTWINKYRLVIVSGETEYADYLKLKAEELGIINSIDFLHGISFSKLKELYASASALVYPSLDEGFGIPPLEAFASGTPAIVSQIPVFVEILEDCAIYVDPNSAESWIDAFKKLEDANDQDFEGLRKYAEKYDLNNMKSMFINFTKKL